MKQQWIITTGNMCEGHLAEKDEVVAGRFASPCPALEDRLAPIDHGRATLSAPPRNVAPLRTVRDREVIGEVLLAGPQDMNNKELCVSKGVVVEGRASETPKD